MKCIRLAGLLAIATSLIAQTATPSKGLIDGKVFNASTGAPLKKVQVRLNNLGPAPGQGIQSGQAGPARAVAGTCDTDDQGHFSFANLPAGRYMLMADRMGFLHAAYGARHFNANGTPIVLTDGQELKDITLKLTPQGVILGRVLDEDGDPLAYTQVMLLRQYYRNGHKEWSQTNGSSSSDIGEFRVAGLEPGRYLMVAIPRFNQGNFVIIDGMVSDTGQPLAGGGRAESAPPKPEMIYADTFFPNALDATSATPIEVGPGSEIHGIDIRLVKVQAVRVRGTVTNVPAPPAPVIGPNGNRVMVGGRGAVMLTLSSPGNNGVAMNRLSAQARPDQNNTFEFRSVPAGAYTLTARAGTPADNLMWAAQPMVVGSSAVEGISVTLSPAMDVQGQISIAEPGTQVKVNNLNINFRPSGQLLIPGTPGGAGKTDDDGKFVLKGIAPGHYTIGIGNMPQGCYLKSAKLGGQDIPDDGIDLSTSAPVELVLGSTAGQMTLNITDKDGKAIPNATVAAIPAGHPTLIKQGTTDENGNLTLKGLAPDTYQVFAWEDVEEGAYADPAFRKPYESSAQEVKVGASSQQTVQMHAIPAGQ